MHVFWQTVCKRAQKRGGAVICEQVKIINKNVAGIFPGKLMTQAVCQEFRADGVRRAGVIAQKIKPGAGKRVLNAFFPEDHEVAGIHAYADDPNRLGLCALLKKPADGRGFAVAHRRDHRCHAAARYGAQALLQALGYVDRV